MSDVIEFPVKPKSIEEFVNRCPAVETHTPRPEGYLAWHSWANRMKKTHRQIKCPTCGLWAIWVKKAARARRATRP